MKRMSVKKDILYSYKMIKLQIPDILCEGQVYVA